MPNKHLKYDRLALWAEIHGPGGLELAETLADSLNLPSKATVLDAGSGTGEISCFLAAEYDWNVLAVDISELGVEVGRSKVEARGLGHLVKVRQGDLRQLELPVQAVDGVFCQGVFEMLEDARPQALLELKRVVRPGGRIAIGGPVLTQTLTPEAADAIYQDTGLFGELETLEWNLALAEQLGLEVAEAYLHGAGKCWWDEFYEPLLNEQGLSKIPKRQPEIDVWRRDMGRYHGIGILVLHKV